MSTQLFLLLFLDNLRRATPKNNNKNNFALICCKFLANLCKSLKMLEQCHVNWWLNYRNNRSVSWRLSCILNFLDYFFQTNVFFDGFFITWHYQLHWDQLRSHHRRPLRLRFLLFWQLVFVLPHLFSSVGCLSNLK